MDDLQVKVSKKYPCPKYVMNFLDSLIFPQIKIVNLDITYLNTYNMIDKINDHLNQINSYYKCLTDKTKNDPISMHEKSRSITLYFLEVEELIYWMRKYIDIIIDISYILNYIKINKKEQKVFVPIGIFKKRYFKIIFEQKRKGIDYMLKV